MIPYTERECWDALERALVTLRSRQADTPQFVWGYNDCYSLLRLYDTELVGVDRLPALRYNSDVEFFTALKQSGYRTPRHFAEAHHYYPSSPLEGVVGLGRMPRRYSVMIYQGSNWITSNAAFMDQRVGEPDYFTHLVRPYRENL